MFSTVKTLAKHSIIYGLGDLLIKLIGFVLIPLYTHYLTTEEYGALELLDKTSYILCTFVALGIADAVLRFYYDSAEKEHRELVTSVALISVWTIAIIGIAILWPFASDISNLVFQSSAYTSHFLLVFATVLFTVGNEVPLTLLRIEEKSLLFIAVSLVRVGIALTLNIVLIVYAGLGVRGILVSALVANMLTGAFLLYYTLSNLKLRFSWSLCKRMLHYGYPLIGGWVGGFVLHFFDRFLLQRYASLSDVGIYALGYKFGFLLNMLLLAPFNRSWGPKRFEIAAQEDAPETFTAVTTYYLFLQTFFTLGIAVVIKEVIRIVSDVEFHDAFIYVGPLLLAYNFWGVFSFMQFGMLYRKRTGLLAFSTLSAGVVNIAANLWLIPIYGTWGACIATIMSFFYLAAVTTFIGQKLYPIRIEWLRIVKMICAALLLYLITTTIEIETLLLSILVKGLIACCLPLVLIPVNFFTDYEKEKFEELKDTYLRRTPSTST